MIAEELRRQADEFIDLIHLARKIGRDPGERAEGLQCSPDKGKET